jgi:4-hydroxy-tetrahydrodipicolinate reductase
MKLAIIGYGRMGKEIERSAIERGHSIGVIIDRDEDLNLQLDQFVTCNAALEFTRPEAAPSNLKKCFESGIPVVCGTTGWKNQQEEIISLCTSLNGSLFHASNFSIGMNIFFAINRHLAEMMNDHDDYDVRIKEIHHQQKLDSPSGTAITLANDILESVHRKTKWVNHPSDERCYLEIISEREGQVPGIHEVEWDSGMDSLVIRHEAKSRKGFVLGALMAAEFISGRKGIFGMKDLLDL